ncbi:MAG TPA: sigma-54 dependent transcriptional regulator [Smithella sp.]|nr:sigma-54 dependent transcriptional regulator [Smithella sp.]
MKPVVLLIDDEPSIQFGFRAYLNKTGYDVQTAGSIVEAGQKLTQRSFDIILLDLSLPDGNGLDLISEIRQNHPEVALVVITGRSDVPVAVKAMQLGADNFLTKPVDMNELNVYLSKSVELKGLRSKEITRKRLDKSTEPYFGESPAVKKALELANVAAGSDSPVIICGQTGTGKGVLAKWIHEHSSRRSGFFVEVNCSALKGDLLSNELFGHARGAFTSAHQDQPGLLEVADGGTLFLDEIGDMDLTVQAQFLKVIEEKKYRRLGEVKSRQSNFRLIGATNQDLPALTKNGRFRLDLYYRINVFPVTLPSLRELGGDINGLILHLLKSLHYKGTGVPPDVLNMLRRYCWPGNIRELRNVLERGLMLSGGNLLKPLHFAGLDLSSSGMFPEGKESSIENAEMLHVKRIMEQCNGDTAAASKILGVSRPTLYRKIKKYNLTNH